MVRTLSRCNADVDNLAAREVTGPISEAFSSGDRAPAVSQESPGKRRSSTAESMLCVLLFTEPLMGPG